MKNLTSDIENIKETLIQFFLPNSSFGCYTDDDQALIGPCVHVKELSLLWFEVYFGSAFRIFACLVETVCKCHIHLYFYTSQMNLVFFIPHYKILV